MTIAKKRYLYKAYRVHLILYFIYIIFGLLCTSLNDIFLGLLEIIISKDILITDYIELTSIGSAMFNVAFVGISCIIILYFTNIKPNGSLIMALWLTTGFAFFGKNIYNIWPAMFGVYLFSKTQKMPFSNYSLVCLLSTSLAPIVTQISFIGIDNVFLEFFLGIFLGIIAGFILPPISVATVKVHSGYNLYNVGFSAGLIGMVFASVAKAFGIKIESHLIWGTTYNQILTIFIIVICLYLILVGFYCMGKKSIFRLREIYKHSGRLVTDYFLMYEETVYINMGILGMVACFIMILIKADINGPTLGGIFTIIGFGAFGKHIFNVVPVLLGAIIGSIATNNTAPANTLSILFSTTLAPISGQFGPVWGIIAGFLHVSIVPNIGHLHSGLNLYNNGFAGGFVALILVPIITSFIKERKNEF